MDEGGGERAGQPDPEHDRETTVPFNGDCNEWAREKAGVASASQYALDDFGHEPEYSAQIEEAWIAQ